MGDWSAEDLARAIERRRGRPRRASGITRADDGAKTKASWSDADWASQFVFLHGGKAKVRGVTQVCVRDTDGAVMWEGSVRELTWLAGDEDRLGFAWFVQRGEQFEFKSAEQNERIRTAEDAVRSQL
ncbi:MAG: hypothetical protein AB7H66_12260 [Hyphomonadaceae bacterium]